MGASGTKAKALTQYFVGSSKKRYGRAQVLAGHRKRVSAVAVIDASTVVSASDDETLRVWDVDPHRKGYCVTLLLCIQ